MENKEFNYNYSAEDQEELKKIRNKYVADVKKPEVNNLERIRKIDAKVTSKATSISIVVGSISTLILGVGMSLIMTDIKYILGSLASLNMIIGIVIGLVGMVGVLVAYPMYQRILKKEREKAAPEILRLMKEIDG